MFKSIWNSYGIIFMVGLILLLSLFNKGKGTWGNPRVNFDENPKGNVSAGEMECKRTMEEIFKKPFNKSRPDFLRNPVTGGMFNMELDCYNEELRIACEYNGEQHYKNIPFFHKNKEAFLNQKYRDELKRRMCRDNGILLIEVPYDVKLCDINRYIKNRLLTYGVLSMLKK